MPLNLQQAAVKTAAAPKAAKKPRAGKVEPKPALPESPIDIYNPPVWVKEPPTIRASLAGAFLGLSKIFTEEQAIAMTIATCLKGTRLVEILKEEEPHMTRGKKEEAAAIDDLELAINAPEQVKFRGKEQLNLICETQTGIRFSAHPDGLIEAWQHPDEADTAPAVVEVKVPLIEGKETTDDTPQYYHQVQVQALCYNHRLFMENLTQKQATGACKWGIFYAFYNRGDEVAEFVKIDTEYLTEAGYLKQYQASWNKILRVLNSKELCKWYIQAITNFKEADERVAKILQLETQKAAVKKEQDELLAELKKENPSPTAFISKNGNAELILCKQLDNKTNAAKLKGLLEATNTDITEIQDVSIKNTKKMPKLIITKEALLEAAGAAGDE